jgi:hypothetical protein
MVLSASRGAGSNGGPHDVAQGLAAPAVIVDLLDQQLQV